MFKHISVLPKEVVEIFGQLDKGEVIVDGTLGKGGHSKLLLEKGFKVIGIDRDKEAIKEASKNLNKFNRVTIVQDNFSNIKKILAKLKIKKVSGILLDLGVSTHQLETKQRGFGFEGKLDMRMNQNQKLTAKDILNKYSEEKLAKILYKNGEKTNAKTIAKNIVQYRQEKKIKDGEQLLEIIKESLSERYRRSRKTHWASPTFRALRIEVNKDFENLEKFLDNFSDCLKPRGVLQIITFHTIEEKIVKRRLRELKQRKTIKLITKKPFEATLEEIRKNPKSRRAKLWIAEKR